MTRSARRRLGVALAVAVVLGGASTAAAHFHAYPYTTKTCPYSLAAAVDPVNVVFYGAANPSRTLKHIQVHAGWNYADGSRQYFSTHSPQYCFAMMGQRASAAALEPVHRFHIRVQMTLHTDSIWGFTSLGDAHHEDTILFPFYCGHAVDKGGASNPYNYSGFDWGRDELWAKLYGQPDHIYAGWSYWGNTREFKQCDGDFAGSDGFVDWWSMPAYSH